MTRPNARGFTMIELLVVVVIIGVVASIAVPTLLNALDRGKQKRTMADLRTLASAIESYSLDHSKYPNTTTLSVMITSVEGLYLQTVPERDAWGYSLIFEGDGTSYTVGSVGKDGGSSLALDGGGGPKQGYFYDIIYSNGSFMQWPEGAQ